MYPEAGGSSSFARHAFNEVRQLLRRLGPDAQLHHHGRDLGLLRTALPLGRSGSHSGKARPTSIFGVGLVAVLAALNVKGTEESAKLNLVLATADLLTQVVLVGIGLVLVFDPDLLVSPGRLRRRADARATSCSGSPSGWSLTPASRRSRTWPRRPGTRSGPCRAASALTVIAVVGLYALLPAIALSAMPVTQDANGEYTTELGTTFADDPVLGIVENLGLGEGATEVAARSTSGVLAAVILLDRDQRRP